MLRVTEYYSVTLFELTWFTVWIDVFFNKNWSSCVHDGRKQGMQRGASGRSWRDVAGHSLLEETCKGFRTSARSAGWVLRSVVTGGDGMGILAADVILGVSVDCGVRGPQFTSCLSFLMWELSVCYSFLRFFSSVIYDYKFLCSWSFPTPAMEICSSFSVVLLSNWCCRERYKDCMKRFALSIFLFWVVSTPDSHVILSLAEVVYGGWL